MVQFVLLYSANNGNVQLIDLSHLAIGDSHHSTSLYFTGLTLSIISVSFSCTAILHKSVIQTFFSLKFIKVLLFILTKFVVQAYLLSLALKNVMLFEVFVPKDTSTFAFQVFNYNNYGLCNKRYLKR